MFLYKAKGCLSYHVYNIIYSFIQQMNLLNTFQEKEPVASAVHLTQDEVIENDWAVMEDFSENQNQRKDWAQRAFQTEEGVGAKALRRKRTWQGSAIQGSK